MQRHDVVHDPLPDIRFDLIHARFVLEHLREREDVLDRLVSALAPGGIIVIESLPAVSPSHRPTSRSGRR